MALMICTIPSRLMKPEGILCALGVASFMRFVGNFLYRRRLLARQMKGHIAVVTGCASGIGLEICLLLASNGWKVYGLDVNDEGLAELRETASAAGLRIVTHVVDVADTGSCDKVFRAISEDFDVKKRGVDVLVNNAGITFPSPVLDTSWDRVHLMYAVNVLVSLAVTCTPCSELFHVFVLYRDLSISPVSFSHICSGHHQEGISSTCQAWPGSRHGLGRESTAVQSILWKVHITRHCTTLTIGYVGLGSSLLRCRSLSPISVWERTSRDYCMPPALSPPDSSPLPTCQVCDTH